jgi:16S rRNA processing protein RimM
MSEYIHIGKIVAAHGLAGHLILEHALGTPIHFKGIDAIFIEKNASSFIPYFIQSASAKTESLTHLQVEGISLVDKSSPLSLLGYMVIENGKELGKVKEVIEQPHQLMVTILYKDNETYIPLHEESLKGVDHAKRQVHVALPDGLLDLAIPLV